MCEASGDPHYKTFDGKRYDYMGLCTYDFVYTCGDYAKFGLKKFLVRTSNEARPQWGPVTTTKSIALVIENEEFKLEKRSVIVNQNVVHPPYKHFCGTTGVEVTITLSCGFLRIQTNFGLVIRYDQNMHVIVELSKAHRGYVCGLCGNFNGDSNDDLIKKDGQTTTNVLQFGNSHQSVNIAENKYCPIVPKPPPAPCEENKQGTIVANKCNILRTHPSFVQCHNLIKPDDAIQDCIFDQCIIPEDNKLSCNIFEKYARDCQRADPTLIIDWVKASGCVPTCPPAENYQISAPICENTCIDRKASLNCRTEKKSACVCNNLYMRSGLSCVPVQNCGCKVDDGQYHQIGESWLTNNCQTKKTCNVGGGVTSMTYRCPTNSVCKPRHAGSTSEFICENNVVAPPPTCGAPPNSATCSITGDPHYKTFDGKTYDFQGACTYDFAYPCGDYAESNLQYFMIRTSNEGNPAWNGVTAIHTVYLILNKKTFAVSRTKVLVDNVEVNPPYVFKYESGMEVSIVKGCNYVQIKTDFGLLIRYDMRWNLFVDLARYYRGKMCGLCGNLNDNPKDDLTDKRGVLTTNVVQFGNSYQSVGVVEMKACKIVVTEPPLACGTAQQKASIETKCSLLLNNPSYKECHPTVDPKLYYDECVYDQCQDIANPKMSCNVFEHYALECKKRANLIIKWKTISGCVPDCGTFEQYLEDVPICENTCGNPNAKEFCTLGKQDGCTCNAGYVRSGLACVLLSNCGCTDVNGIYHKVGDTWLSNNCRNKNTCSAPNKIDVVTSIGCNNEQECKQVDASTWQCVNKITTCEVNEHFDENKSVCEDTCQNPDFSKRCKAGTSPGCVCDKGFTKFLGVCISSSLCGCVDNDGNYLQPGTIWMSNDCKYKYTCKSGGEVTTTYVGTCQGTCKLSGSTYACEIVVPPPINPCLPQPNSGICEASGDPHYKTFDGKRYDYMGLCTYDFVYTCGDYTEAGLKNFLVRTSNEARPQWGPVTTTKSIALVFGDEEFKLEKGSVIVNQNVVHPPYKHICGTTGVEITITLSCGFLRIQTNFGLVIRYDRNMHVMVELSNAHKGYVCGLCGNFNGNPSDDLIKNDGQTTTNVVQFGNSHQSTKIVENKYCPIVVKPPPTPCEANKKETVVTNKCSILRTHPSFVKCHNLVKPDDAIQDCIFDQCIIPDDTKLSCNIIERYARDCQRADPSLSIDWVAASGCVPACPVNEHYELAAITCENTCMNRQASLNCSAERRPACVCNNGLVRSGITCISTTLCGCKVNDGQYYQFGESWLSNNCQTKHNCFAGGRVTTQKFSCPANSVCKPRHAGETTDYICENNILIPPATCVSPPNSGRCIAMGDPHYYTFDLVNYNFQGACTYDFVYACGDYAEVKLPYFMVRTSNEGSPLWGGATVIHTVTLILNKKKFIISRTKVLVDNAEVNPPYVYKFDDDEMKVTIVKGCNNVQIRTDFGLLIRYDMKMNLIVDLARYYEGRVCGLCGNFNGNKQDEFITKRGVLTANVVQFANSYQSIGVVEMPGCKIVATEPPIACGTAAQKASIEAKCSLLLNNQFFKECHSKVDPKQFYDDCVYDQCREIANPKMSCNVFEQYALECKKRAELIIKWKTISGCVPACGTFEQYLEDVPACENTCINPSAKDFCTNGKHDGCTCIAGYVRSGLACVSLANCGCTDVNGIYHKVGDVWLSNNCRSKNTCSAPDQIDVLISNGCQSNQDCKNVDASTWQCVTRPTDCKDLYGKSRPLGSSWTTEDCATKYTCLVSGEVTTEDLKECKGECLQKESITEIDYYCKITVLPPPPPPTVKPIATGCKDGQGITRDLASSWRSSNCQYIYTCQCDGILKTTKVGSCDPGFYCRRLPGADKPDYYCAYDADVCPLILD